MSTSAALPHADSPAPWSVVWRVVYEPGRWDSFVPWDVPGEPSGDPATRAFAAATAARAAGGSAHVLCEVGGTWSEVMLAPVCDECGGTGSTVQGWTDKSGVGEDQYGPCMSCNLRAQSGVAEDTGNPRDADTAADADPPVLEMVGFNTPTTLEAARDMLDDLAHTALEHLGCPTWCGDCLTWERPRTCGACRGSGCGPGTGLGAYDPCETCAGDGRDHPGEPVDVRAAVLAEVRDLLDAEIAKRPDKEERTQPDFAVATALADVRAAIADPGSTFPPAAD